jgi:integrase
LLSSITLRTGRRQPPVLFRFGGTGDEEMGPVGGCVHRGVPGPGDLPGRVSHTESKLRHWGSWLRSRRPRPGLEQIDAELLVRYLESRSAFRSKATVYGTLSTMRGFGDYLVREGFWRANPLRWMKGGKVTPYSRLPRRIERAHMEALWREAARSRGEFSRALWLTVLALLYGTGLRRGELERLDVAAFDRTEATLRIDGRKSGRERCVRRRAPSLMCAVRSSAPGGFRRTLPRGAAVASDAAGVSAVV